MQLQQLLAGVGEEGEAETGEVQMKQSIRGQLQLLLPGAGTGEEGHKQMVRELQQLLVGAGPGEEGQKQMERELQQVLAGAGTWEEAGDMQQGLDQHITCCLEMIQRRQKVKKLSSHRVHLPLKIKGSS